MNNDRLEQELRTYFRCEAEAATPPQDWWQSAVLRATAASQSGPRRGLAAWARNLLDILRINPEKPFWGVATMVVVLFMFVIVSYGAGVVIANFPGGSTGTPPTAIPPTVTGSVPPMTITNTTISLPQTSTSQWLIVIGLTFVSLCALTFSLLVWRWRRNRVI